MFHWIPLPLVLDYQKIPTMLLRPQFFSPVTYSGRDFEVAAAPISMCWGCLTTHNCSRNQLLFSIMVANADDPQKVRLDHGSAYPIHHHCPVPAKTAFRYQRSKSKPSALRIAASRESVAAPQQGLWALIGMVGFKEVRTVRSATRLSSRLLSDSNYILQSRATPDDCASRQLDTQTSANSLYHLNLDSRWVGCLDTENGKTTSLGRYQGSSSSTT